MFMQSLMTDIVQSFVNTMSFRLMLPLCYSFRSILLRLLLGSPQAVINIAEKILR